MIFVSTFFVFVGRSVYLFTNEVQLRCSNVQNAHARTLTTTFQKKRSLTVPRIKCIHSKSISETYEIFFLMKWINYRLVAGARFVLFSCVRAQSIRQLIQFNIYRLSTGTFSCSFIHAYLFIHFSGDDDDE